MKIAINITREHLAGITSTNLNLLNHLHGSDVSFIGIELNPQRVFKSPISYRHLSPEWFDHRIISICDFQLLAIVKKSKSLKDVEKHFSSIIDLVRELLRKEKPDKLIINGTYYIPWILSIAAKKEKIPVALWYAGVLTKETEKMTAHNRKIFSDMEKGIIKNSEQIIFPSQICKKIVLDQVLNNAVTRKGVVIPNPISPLFTRISHIEQSVERNIAFVGRNTPIKNMDQFCVLHKQLLKQGWNHEATIVSDVSKEKMKKIPKTIKVISSMIPADIRTFYATQGLIISPSHFETFGNTPLEAACMGIPVLVSDTMGCSDVLIAAGLKDMVINFRDNDSVLERIKNLCGQHILPRQINNLRKIVDPKYVANKMSSIFSIQ